MNKNSILLLVTLFTACFLMLSKPAQADRNEPYTPLKGSPERKAIMDSIRLHMKNNGDMVFKVEHLKIRGEWGWIETSPQSRDGKSQFEGVNALLKKQKGRWKVQYMRPCCGECEDDPVCSDDKRFFEMLKKKYPGTSTDIFPDRH